MVVREQHSSRNALLLLAALASCGFPKPADIADGGSKDDLAVTLDASRVRIRAGTTATVGVRLTRGDATGTVILTVGGLPVGVTADPLTIDVDENTGTLTFRSIPAATQGDTALTITASTPTQSHDVALSLLTMGPPGTLDPSFGVGGMAAISRGGHGDAILTQPDGKILISGVAVAADGANNIMAARYLPDGSIDGSFAGGVVLLAVPPTLTTRVSLALQPDGKLVIVSTSGTQGVVDRLNSNGSHDDSFGSGGEQLFKAGTAQSTNLAAVAVQPAGGIVLAGDADGQALVARLTSTGMLDATFNTVGYTAVPDIGANARFLAVALQSDMRIVAAGFGTPAGSRTLTGFARLDPAGHLDSGFHGNGSLVIDSCAGIDFIAYASIAFQQDSKIVAVGGSNSVGQGAGCAVRLAANGAPDLAFGTDGRTLVALDSFTSAMVLQSDGKLVVAGGMLVNSVQSAFVARYQNNAGPDSNFGTHGSTAVTLAGSSQFEAITLDSDGRILATGFSAGSPDQILLCRFWP